MCRPMIIAACFLASSCFADINVQTSDFVGSEYTYIVPNSHNTTYQAGWANAREEASNVTSGPSFFFPTYFISFGGSEAHFTFLWNFPPTAQPVAVTITDRLTLFSDNGNNRTLATVSYSLDGGAFTPIWSLTTPTDGSAVGDAIETNQVVFGQPVTAFRYRVDIETLPGDSNGQTDSWLDEWGRTTQNSPTLPFTAVFTTTAPCICEYDGDNTEVGIDDLLAFLSLWFGDDASADANGDGVINVDDLLAFLSCWFQGC